MLDRAAELLRAGDLVAVPTETVYGLAADATNAMAVAKLFERKRRASFQPISVLCPSAQMAFSLLADVPESAVRLATRFWPGPLTMILPKHPAVLPDLLTAGLPFVGVRVPAHPLALALLQRFGRPLAAPSANRSGHVSPTTAEAVRSEFGKEIDLVLDGGPCRIGVESTVISFLFARPALVRQGGVPQELLEEEIGPLEREAASPTASGGLHRPYAMRTPLYLVQSPEAVPIQRRTKAGLLAWGPQQEGFAVCLSLSPTFRLEEAAANLFHQLRELDQSGLDCIFAMPVPDHGLGRAINQRLQKAAESSVPSPDSNQAG